MFLVDIRVRIGHCDPTTDRAVTMTHQACAMQPAFILKCIDCSIPVNAVAFMAISAMPRVASKPEG